MNDNYRGWMYAKVGDYHRQPDPDWSYTPTYLRKTKIVDDFIQSFPGGSRLIDVGCGEGIFVERWADRGIDITGMDLNYESEFVRRGDIRNMPFGDSQFDGVLFLDVLEHLPFSDQLLALTEIQRIMNREGTLLLIVPNLSHLNSRFRFFFRGNLDRTDNEIDHLGERPFRENINLIKAVGLTIVSISGITFPLPWLYRRVICRDARKYRWLHDFMEPLARTMPSLAMFNIFVCKKF